MRIAVASAFGCGVGLWKRLADEGNEVMVYIGDSEGGPVVSHRKVGQGIVQRTDSWYGLLAWAKEKESMMLFDSSGLGNFADQARRAGVHVIGSGSFMDRLEKDRLFGQHIAERAGVKIPPYKEFGSLDETIAFARNGLETGVYFKSDTYIDSDATHGADDSEELVEYLTWLKTKTRNKIKNILQEKIDGFALSTARWWNGRSWIGPYEWTYERKKFMPGDVGPSTGCSLNAVGFYEDENPLIAQALNWEETTSDFLKNEAPPGLYDINAIVNEGEAYFLEWTPRFGWDSEGTSFLLYPNFSEHLWHVATGQGEFEQSDEIGFSIRLSVPPYPWEHGERDEKGTCVGVPIRGETGDLWSEGFVAYEVMQDEHGLAVAAPEGLVGLSAAVGSSVESLAQETLDFAKDLRIPGLQYRNDAGACILEDAERTIEEGFDDIPDGLLN